MISGKTKVVALIGDPVEHSISPEMQNVAFRELDLDYVYLAFKVPEESLKDSVRGMRSLGLVGANVTIPHKTSIMKYLDELTNMAKKIGAVNTIKKENKHLKGYNTDGVGALRALKRELDDIKNKNVILLGAGGSARAISFVLVESGADLTISNRTSSTASELCSEIKEKTGVYIKQIPLEKEELEKSMKKSDILINSTPVGMHPHTDDTLVEKEIIDEDLVVMDIVYNPLKTRLLQEADEAGAKTISGIEMLVQQGAASFEIWTGEEPPIEIMRNAAIKAMKER